MAISIGDTLPGGAVLEMTDDGPKEVDIAARFAGRNVVLFGLPGAYTGTCTTAHMPSFVRTAEAFADKGVDEIICVTVNDPFVANAWAVGTGAKEAGITVLADASGAFTKAMGKNFDAPPVGFFGRSKRYALYAEAGTVKQMNEEASPGECEISAGETLLAQL